MVRVSIVMPVYNEADHIARSLRAIFAQTYPHDKIEVIIADGRSTDATRRIITDLMPEAGRLSLQLIDNPQRITAAGLNRALGHASGDVIIRVDGHCEIAPDYVSRCVAHLERGEADGVGGPIDTIAMTPAGQAIAAAMSSWYGVGGAAFRTVRHRAMYVDTVPFPAYTRAAVERAGPYDETLVRNQDDEYNYRLRKLGGRILLAPDVRSRYISRQTLRQLWEQYYQYGFYKVRVMQKHPRQMRPRQFVPPLFASALIGGALLAPFLRMVRVLWGLLLLVYLCATLLASLLTARRTQWRHLPRLPLAYATLHLSYGLGFLSGLIHFR